MSTRSDPLGRKLVISKTKDKTRNVATSLTKDGIIVTHDRQNSRLNELKTIVEMGSS